MAGTPTLELDEGNVSTFAIFEYEGSSSKTERVFETTNLISSFFFLKCWNVTSLELRKGSGWSYSQRNFNTIANWGGKKIYDNSDYDGEDDDDDDDYDNDGDDDYNVFSSSQRISNRVGTRGSR